MAARQSAVAGALPARLSFTVILFFALITPLLGLAASDPADKAGEAIYRQGVLSSGAAIAASRGAGMRVSGVDAACINCHQRSGLGSQEGRRVIPPITGRYLFRQRSAKSDDDDLPYVEGVRNDRDPYSDASLARAIRDGVDSRGRILDYLMPRFELGDADMTALIAYLKRLDPPRSPGVTDTVLHFATVVTPDADPVKVAGMLDVMEQYFADKNAAPLGATPRLRSSRKLMFMVNRRWQLHVWRLSGPPSGWEDQLDRHLAEEPVLAVVSGIGGATWAPVQAFCEHQAVPCLFPNVEAPPADADRNFYSLYFSRGVLLESELIANDILRLKAGKPVKVLRQIYRAGDSGEPAARALAATLGRHGIAVRNSVIARGAPPGDVAKVARSALAADALVMWLRPSDLAALGATRNLPRNVYMSGTMGGLERSPLAADWRRHALIAYPFDLPDRRIVRVNYAFGWFSIRHIPIVADRIQADTYLACGLLAETLSHMADTFVRDYLVERVVDMLGHRILTGYYPRLTLATGQRFASKGGYIVRFTDASGTRVTSETDWNVP